MRKVFSLTDREQSIEELKKILSQLQQEHNLNPQQALELATASPSVPLSVFASDRGPLESLVIYLHTGCHLDFKTISALLKRSYQTVWTSFKLGSAKPVGPSNEKHALAHLVSLPIPYSIFSDERLSISEALCRYLHETQRLRLRDIAILLNRDQRTVWTMHHRATKKVSSNEKT